MTYNKTNWTDRQVQNPMTFSASGAVTGTVTLTPNEGTIIQAGTPITSANLNNLENGVAGVDSRLTTVEGAYLNKNANGQINGDLGLNIAPAYGFHQLGGSQRNQALSNPTTPTITNVGATGSSSYSYYVVANDGNGGKTLVSPVGTTATGNATLSSSNYNKITWTAIAGAQSYDILKGDTGHSIALAVVGTTFNDTGIASSAYTAPVRNTTADTMVDGYVLGQMPNMYARGGLWSGAIGATNTLEQFPVYAPSIVTGNSFNGFHTPNNNDVVCDVAGRYVIGVWATISGLNPAVSWEILIRRNYAGGGYADDVNGTLGYSGLGGNYTAPDGPILFHEIILDLAVGDKLQFFTRAGESPRSINNFFIKIFKIA
jgi:hypothetical protein